MRTNIYIFGGNLFQLNIFTVETTHKFDRLKNTRQTNVYRFLSQKFVKKVIKIVQPQMTLELYLLNHFHTQES
jgi:hypothetical protein